jgi:hypothetical protein
MYEKKMAYEFDSSDDAIGFGIPFSIGILIENTTGMYEKAVFRTLIGVGGEKIDEAGTCSETLALCRTNLRESRPPIYQFTRGQLM